VTTVLHRGKAGDQVHPRSAGDLHEALQVLAAYFRLTGGVHLRVAREPRRAVRTVSLSTKHCFMLSSEEAVLFREANANGEARHEKSPGLQRLAFQNPRRLTGDIPRGVKPASAEIVG